MRNLFSSTTQKRAAYALLVSCGLGVYAPVMYAPVDPHVDQGCRQILVNVGTVLDIVETKIDGLGNDFDSTFTAIKAVENCCITVNSKVDVIDNNVDLIRGQDFAQTWTAIKAAENCCITVNSKVDVIDNNVDLIRGQDFVQTWTAIKAAENCCITVNSKVDVIDNLVDLIRGQDFVQTWTAIKAVENCCLTVNSKVDELFIDFKETWTMLGDYRQKSASVDSINTIDLIDTSTLSIVQWLKTIYRRQLGL